MAVADAKAVAKAAAIASARIETMFATIKAMMTEFLKTVEMVVWVLLELVLATKAIVEMAEAIEANEVNEAVQEKVAAAETKMMALKKKAVAIETKMLKCLATIAAVNAPIRAAIVAVEMAKTKAATPVAVAVMQAMDASINAAKKAMEAKMEMAMTKTTTIVTELDIAMIEAKKTIPEMMAPIQIVKIGMEEMNACIEGMVVLETKFMTTMKMVAAELEVATADARAESEGGRSGES